MTWRAEWLLEAADIEVAYGSADTAASLLDEARATAMLHTLRNYAITIEARLALRMGQFDLALDRANAFEVGSPSEVPGFMSRQLAIQGSVAVVVVWKVQMIFCQKRWSSRRSRVPSRGFGTSES